MPSMSEFGTINMQQAPLLNSKQQAAVIIDSDEENDTMQPLNPSTIQSAISQIPSCASVTNMVSFVTEYISPKSFSIATIVYRKIDVNSLIQNVDISHP